MSIFERPSSIGFTLCQSEAGSLQDVLLCLAHYSKAARGVFVQTIFCPYEGFDSAAIEWMRGPCHLFVKRCLQLGKNVSGASLLFSHCLCFSPQSHQASTPGKRKSGLPRRLSIKEGGPLKFPIRRVVGQAEMWPLLTTCDWSLAGCGKIDDVT
jgi:hypothetical protein